MSFVYTNQRLAVLGHSLKIVFAYDWIGSSIYFVCIILQL